MPEACSVFPQCVENPPLLSDRRKIIPRGFVFFSPFKKEWGSQNPSPNLAIALTVTQVGGRAEMS
jgi:hypothetical protein